MVSQCSEVAFGLFCGLLFVLYRAAAAQIANGYLSVFSLRKTNVILESTTVNRN